MAKKDKHICTVECPSCSATLEIVREREVITAAVKGENKDVYRAEKSEQRKLGES